jgi:hypothetical protein
MLPTVLDIFQNGLKAVFPRGGDEMNFHMLVLKDGTKQWMRDGVWIRQDGPAVIFFNGDKFYNTKSGKKFHEKAP